MPHPRTTGWLLLILGLLLVGTAYFGTANPLFFGAIPGLEAGCAMAGLGAGLIALDWERRR